MSNEETKLIMKSIQRDITLNKYEHISKKTITDTKQTIESIYNSFKDEEYDISASTYIYPDSDMVSIIIGLNIAENSLPDEIKTNSKINIFYTHTGERKVGCIATTIKNNKQNNKQQNKREGK